MTMWFTALTYVIHYQIQITNSTSSLYQEIYFSARSIEHLCMCTRETNCNLAAYEKQAAKMEILFANGEIKEILFYIFYKNHNFSFIFFWYLCLQYFLFCLSLLDVCYFGYEFLNSLHLLTEIEIYMCVCVHFEEACNQLHVTISEWILKLGGKTSDASHLIWLCIFCI